MKIANIATLPTLPAGQAMIDFPASVEFLPGTDQPIPALMTAQDACRFLRLDVGRNMKNAIKALNRLVDKDLIRPCLVGNHRRYSHDELRRFIGEATERYGDVG